MALSIGHSDFNLKMVINVHDELMRLINPNVKWAFDDLRETCNRVWGELSASAEKENKPYFEKIRDSEIGQDFELEVHALNLIYEFSYLPILMDLSDSEKFIVAIQDRLKNALGWRPEAVGQEEKDKILADFVDQGLREEKNSFLLMSDVRNLGELKGIRMATSERLPEMLGWQIASDDTLYARKKNEKLESAAKLVRKGLLAGMTLPKLKKAATSRYLPEIQQLAKYIHVKFLDHLQELPICLPKETPTPIESWKRVERLFDTTNNEFESLPVIVQKGFQQAAWCIVFEQYIASAVMAMRTAEAMLREYYYRMYGEEPQKRDTWGKLLGRLDQLGVISEDILEVQLQQGQSARNSLLHPRLELVQGYTDASDFFTEAKKIVRFLLKDLSEKRKRLTVCVPGGRDLDILIAVWLLARVNRGIGRVIFVNPKSDEPDDKTDIGKSVTIVGLEGGDYFAPIGESHAKAVAVKHQLEKKYKLLLDYCEKWTLATWKNHPVVESNDSLTQLKNFLENLANAFKGKSDEWIYYRKIALLDHLMDHELNLLDQQHLGEPQSEYDKFAKNELKEVSMDSALKNGDFFHYRKHKSLATIIETSLWDDFTNRLFTKDYKLVVLMDKEKLLLIRSCIYVDWPSLKERLEEKNVEVIIGIDKSELRCSLSNVKLSINGIKGIILDLK